MIAFVLVSVLALLLLLDWIRKYWFGLPFPQSMPLPLLGHLLRFIDTRKFADALMQESLSFPSPVSKINLLGSEFVVVRGVENNRAVLLAKRDRDEVTREVVKPIGSGLFRQEFGSNHQELRKIFNPFLSSNAYQDTIQEILGTHLLRMKARFRQVAAQGLVVDLEQEFQRAMFDAIVELVCGAQIDSIADPKYYVAWETILKWLQWLFVIQNTAYWQIIGDTQARKEFLQAEQLVREVVRHNIVQLQSATTAVKSRSIIGAYLLSGDTRLNVEQMVDHALNFLWGGNDSTRFILVMAAVESSRHRDSAAAVRDEMRRLLSNGEEFPTADNLSREQAPHINAYVSELLRMYPPFPFTISRMAETVALPSCNTSIPEGTNVITLMGLDQIDPKEWGSDAAVFNPGRWISMYASGSYSEPKAFQLFGNGLRSCVGKKLAMMDVRLFVGGLLKDFEFQLCDPKKFRIFYEVSYKTEGASCAISLAKQKQ